MPAGQPVTSANSEANADQASPTSLVPDLPESVPYVVIGGGTACFAAVRSIRSSDPTSKVLIISESQHLPYMKPPLSKELWYTPPEVAAGLNFRQFDGRDRPLSFEKPEFYFQPKVLMERASGGVSLIRGQRVEKIDCDQQLIHLTNGQSLKYGKCLIATGGEPHTHPVLEAAGDAVGERVIGYRHVDDFLKLQAGLSTMKTVMIHGGGLLGTELAVSMASKGKDSGLKVIQVFPEPGVLWNILPQYLSKWLSAKVQAAGVELRPESDLKSAASANDAERNSLSIELTDGSKFLVDRVIVTTRTDAVSGPNRKLAEASGLELDQQRGGFVANAELQVRTNVWVAGDAASFYDVKLGRRRVEQHDQAIISGRLAGENMTGVGKALQQQAMFWSDLTPDLGFEAAGLIDSCLDTVAVFAADPAGDGVGHAGRPEQESAADYKKGVVFYLQDKKIVGILMMNVFNRVRLARRILKDGRQQEDLADVAKWFNIYSAEE